MRTLIALLTLAGLLPGTPLTQPSTDWHFALDTRANVVIAYTLDGQIRPAREDVTERPTGYRVTSDTALLFENRDDGLHASLVTPGESIDILHTFAEAHVPAAYHYPYAVFVPARLRPEADDAVLINVVSGETVVLGPVVSRVESDGCCVFSADGRSLHYIAVQAGSAAGNAVYSLLQRDLASGQETTRYQFTSSPAAQLRLFDANNDGTVWQQTTRLEENSLRVESIALDGSSQLIAQVSAQKLAAFPQPFLAGDLVFATAPTCATPCTAQITPPGASSPRQFLLRPEDSGSAQLIHYDGESAVILARTAVVRIFPDASPVIVGYYNPINTVSPFVSGDATHALLALSEAADSPAVLVDLRTGETLHTLSMPASRTALFCARFDAAVILVMNCADLGAGFALVDTGTGSSQQGTPPDGMIPFAPLNPGEALAYSEGDAAGIYRIRAGAAEVSLVLAGAYVPLLLADIDESISAWG